MPALNPCAGEFVLRGHSAAIGSCDRGRAVKRTAGDFIVSRLTFKRVGQSDHDHAVMQQRGDHRENGRFLAAMLGPGTRDYRSDQRTLWPEAAGLIEEVPHL